MPRVAASATFKATDYNLGGEGVAYHDRERANLAHPYGLTHGPDVATLAAPGAQRTRDREFLSYTFAGEWLNYTFDIEAARSYTLSVQVASLGPGGTFHFELDGAVITGPLSIPGTGGWTSFRSLSVPNLAFPAGRHALRLVMDTNSPGGGVGSFKTIALLGAGWATQ